MNTGVDYPFTGKKEDESSLYYFGARYYDDNLGRFISVDPVRENEPYSYVRNNPIMLVDPTGMDEEGVPPVMSHEFGIDHLMNQETQDFLNRNDPEYMMNRFYEERYLQMEQGKEQLNLIVPYRSLRRINEAHMRGEQADVGDYVNFISAGMLWATGLIKAGNAMRGLSFGRLGSVRTPSNLGRGMPVRSSNLIESLETGLKGERKSLPEVLKVFDDHLASGALDPISHQAYVEGTVELAFTEVQGHVVSPHTAARLMVRASQNGLATNAASPATGGRNIMSSILSEGKQTVYSNGAIEYNLNNNLLIIREPETSMISTFISRQ